MKEEIKIFKEKYERTQGKAIGLNRLLFIISPNKANSDEVLRFANFMLEKAYGEGYLLSFLDCMNEQSELATQKYENILKQTNEHLVKIIEEYKQMTEELDAIIFKGEGAV